MEAGETDQAALARELREEMGIDVEVGERSIHVEHSYEAYDVDFCVYRCRLISGPIRHVRVHAHRWVRPATRGHRRPSKRRLLKLLPSPIGMRRSRGSCRSCSGVSADD